RDYRKQQAFCLTIKRTKENMNQKLKKVMAKSLMHQMNVDDIVVSDYINVDTIEVATREIQLL
ncbi:2144_t:CDS:1, partial [Paraglomus occultum]